MEKSDRPQSLATIATDVGLFVHLGNRRPNEIERLKEGAGGSMRQIEAAIDRWREQLESLIDRFVEQLDQVFMLRVFHVDTIC